MPPPAAIDLPGPAGVIDLPADQAMSPQQGHDLFDDMDQDLQDFQARFFNELSKIVSTLDPVCKCFD